MPFTPPPRSLSRKEFVDRFGGVYEHSDWVADRAWEKGLGAAEDDATGLHNRLRAIVEEAGPEAQLVLLRAHPDLAGRAAIAGKLTEASTSEQASAGLDHCSPEQFQRFQELNQAYHEKFRFPFILAVKGRNRHEILAAFEERLNNSPEIEFREALNQVHQIALLRLQALAEAK